MKKNGDVPAKNGENEDIKIAPEKRRLRWKNGEVATLSGTDKF